MTISFQVDDWMQCLDQFKQVCVDHYDEIETLKDFPLDPDYDTFEAIYRAGKMVYITAKDEGKLVGYMVFFITPHMHSKNCLTAHEDIYFLMPEYRKGRNGIKMFKLAEDYLKSIGVDLIISATKIKFDYSSLFKYLGYKPIDKVFTKVIRH
jgi:hypothetical protein